MQGFSARSATENTTREYATQEMYRRTEKFVKYATKGVVSIDIFYKMTGCGEGSTQNIFFPHKTEFAQ